MKNINEILSFEFDSITYANRAIYVVNKFIVNDINERAEEIIKLSSFINNNEINIPKEININNLFDKLKNGEKTNLVFSRNELRIMCYYLYKIESENNSECFIGIINNKWNNSYINGILDYIFQFWDISNNIFLRIKEFLLNKLKEYNGNNAKFNAIKRNIVFLENNGPTNLGATLKAKGESITSFTGIFKISIEKISYSYFSYAIYSYYSYKFDKNIDYNKLLEILEKHNNPNTDKIVLSYIIVSITNPKEEDKNELIHLSKIRIGDCENNSKWYLNNSFSSEKLYQLEKAKEKIKMWTAEKYINVYFELCVDDPRRKKFWIKYISKIENIRIIGSDLVFARLNSDERLSEILNSKFISLKSKTVATSALVMSIKEHIFVEFSDVGALYIYNRNSKIIDNIFERKYYNSIGDIKNTYMNNIVENYYSSCYFNEEGRLVHRGEWENRLRNWFEYKQIYT